MARRKKTKFTDTVASNPGRMTFNPEAMAVSRR
jgi:hypothetical protein